MQRASDLVNITNIDKELLLLRHGKSDWDKNTDDFHRPLKQRGIQDAIRIGSWLQQQNLQPDFVLSSPAERAIATTEQLCKTIDYTVQQINRDKRIYAANISILKKILCKCPAHIKRVLLVGHNPELEELLMDLTGGNIDIPEDGKLLATATLARLKMPNNWNKLPRGCAELISITRARSLPD